MAGGRFSIESVFKAVDKVSRPVSKMQNRVRKFTRATSKGVDRASRSFRNLGSSIKSSAAIGAASIAILAAAMLPVINTTAKFEQSIVNAAAKFPGMVKDGKLLEGQLKKLEDVARKTGATTEFTASQSADALNFLAMAGFTAEQAIGALPKVVDLATAAQVDLATASDIATDSLGAFGLATDDPVQQTKNLSRVIDAMAKTSVTANTNMEQMMEAIKNGGPVATAAGASLETFLALTGQLANAGIKGSDAGTTLKNVFVRLQGPVGKASKLLRRMGVATKDSNGNLRDVVDILGDLDKGLAGLGTAERGAAIKEIFGKIPLAGVNVLLGVGTDKLKAYRRELERSAGASAEMAGVMRNTLQGRINTLKSSFEGLQITIGKTNSGPINSLVTGITRLIRVVDEAVATNSTLGKTIKTMAGLILAVTLGIAAFSTVTITAKVAMFAWSGAVQLWTAVTKIATAAQWLWNAAMAANPVGAVIAALLAVIAVGILVARNWDNLTEKWNQMSTAGKIFIGVLAMMFSPITVAIAAVVGLIKAGQWLVDNWQWVSDFFGEFFRGFSLGFSTLADEIGGFADAFILPFSPLLSVLDFILEKIGAVIDKFKVIDKVKKGLGEAFDFVKTAVGLGEDSAPASVRAVERTAQSRPQSAPKMVTPQERIARQIDETRTTASAEVTIRAEEGTSATMNQSNRSPLVAMNLVSSGAF